MPDFLPLELDKRDRDLLADLVHLAGEPRLLLPYENTIALKLESMGLCKVSVDPLATSMAGFGATVSSATVTEAGWRVIAGPLVRLATLDGVPACTEASAGEARRVGKKAAGNVLDGWVWDQQPEATP